MRNRKYYMFTLSDYANEVIDYYVTNDVARNRSLFVELLVQNYDYSNDPIKEMENVKKEIGSYKEKIKELETKEGLVLERMKAHKHFEEEKKEIEQRALEILKRAIVNGKDKVEISNIAKFWGYRLNKDYKELIYRSSELIKTH